MPDYRSLLSNPDRVVAVVDFLSTRFGLSVEPCASGDGSWALLCEMWEAGADRVLCRQNRLLRSAQSYRQDDLVVFFVENQSLWSIGVVPTEEGDPPVFSLVDGNPPMPLGIGLAEFLIRASVEEAIFSSPWTTGGPVEREGVLTTVGREARLMPAVPVDRLGNQLPSIWADGEALAIGVERERTVKFFAGADTVEAFEQSRLAGACGWSRWERPEA